VNFDLSVVVPTLRNSSSLQDCLNSIVLAANTSKLFVELLVVDNSRKQEIDLKFNPSPVSEFVKLRFLRSPKGANKARNRGLEQASAEVVLFVDDDCIAVDSCFLSKHFSFHQKNTTAFAAGGSYITSMTATPLEVFYVEGQRSWLQRGRHQASNRINFLLGGNFSLKKSIAIRNNLRFDENLQYGGTETEFFVHANSKDLESYFIEANVEHRCRFNFFQLCKKAYRQGLGKQYRERKWTLAVANRIYVQGPSKSSNHEQMGLLNVLQSWSFKFGYHFKPVFNQHLREL
jgi:glycosyltransferase involved in cell wall biosynthesis